MYLVGEVRHAVEPLDLGRRGASARGEHHAFSGDDGLAVDGQSVGVDEGGRAAQHLRFGARVRVGVRGLGLGLGVGLGLGLG